MSSISFLNKTLNRRAVFERKF